MSEPGPQQGRESEGSRGSGGDAHAPERGATPPEPSGQPHGHGHHHFHGALARLRSWFDPVEAAAVLKRARQRQRVARRWKRAAWITAAVAGGCLGAYWLVTQSFLTRWVVLSQIRPEIAPMGLDVAASGVRWMGGTWFELRGARVIASGIEGRAGTLFQARSVRVRIDPDAISGKAQGLGVLEVQLDEPLVRVSVDPSGAFNIAQLTLPSAKTQVGVLPRVEVNGGAIEMGEHEADGAYRPLQRIEVSGLVERDPSDQEYRIRFRELPGRAPGEPRADEGGPAPLTGMRVEGRFDSDELELRLDNVDFSAWSAERVPGRYREYYRRMDLKGKGRAQMAYRFARGGVVAGSRVTLDLEDVEVGLPPQALGTDDTGEAWARMRGVRGLIEFDAGRIIADISGRLEELPYKVRVRWDGPEPDAAFRALVEAGPFTLLEKPRILRFASDTVRYRLAQFGNPTGQVESLVQVERQAPARNEKGEVVASPIRTFGALYMSDVKAKFWRFPYPFENLKGTVRFTEDEIVLEEISGTSPRGATIVATGRIAPIDDNAAVNIDVKVRGVPLDELMEEAMRERARLFRPGADPENPPPPLAPGELADAEGQAMILRVLFNVERYRDLLSRGLVLSVEEFERLNRVRAAIIAKINADLSTGAIAQQIEAQRAVLAQIDERLKIPVFRFRGNADVDVTVRRRPGPESIWDDVTEVRFAQAGVLPEKFPYPIHARDVTIRVGEGKVTVRGGEYRGLSGGVATVEATGDADSLDRGGFEPAIRVEARGVPVDELLISAVPDRAEADRAGADRAEAGTRGVRDMLRDLRISGEVDCTAIIAPFEGRGYGYDVRMTAQGLDAQGPSRGPDAENVALRSVAGELRVDDERVIVDMAGTVERSRPQDGEAAQDAGRASVRVEWLMGSAREETRAAMNLAPNAYRAEVRGERLLIDAPVESLVGAVSPEAERTLAQLRSEYQPSGRLNLWTRVEGAPSGELDIVARGDHLEDLSLRLEPVVAKLRGADAPGEAPAAERVSLTSQTAAENSGGAVGVSIARSGARTLNFDRFTAEMSEAGKPTGRLSMSGSLPIGDATAPGPAAATPAPVGLAIRAGRFESAVVREIVRARLGERLWSMYREHRPAGEFDLDMTLVPEFVPGAPQGWTPRGSISPRSASFTARGTRVELREIVGTLSFDGLRGAFSRLVLTAPSWSFTGFGDWSVEPAGLEFRGGYDLTSSRGLTDDLRAIMPEAVHDLARDLALKADGPMSLGGTINLDPPAQVGGDQGVSAKGTLRFDRSAPEAREGASMDVGLPMTEAIGSVRFEVDRPAQGTAAMTEAAPEGPKLRFRVDADLASARLAGVRITHGQARVTHGAREGEVAVPLLEAWCYGGRLAGSVNLRPAEWYEPRRWLLPSAIGPAIPDPSTFFQSITAPAREFEGDFKLSGVGLNGVLDDLANLRAPAEPRPPVNARRGEARVTAGLSIGGITGDPTTRRGRGSAEFGGGEIIALPLVLPLIRVSNLQLPSDEPLDGARVRLFLAGQRVEMEQLTVWGPNVEILGFGTMTWPSTDLDMVFNSRSTSRVPILSALIEGIRDELITTRVRGTLGEPRVEVIPLRNIGGAIGRALRGGPSDQERRMMELEQTASRESERRRVRRDPSVGRQIEAQAREPQ